MTIAVAVLAALMAQAATPPRVPAECPRLSMTFWGGLGVEAQSGVVFAIWDSGVVVRASRGDEPSGAHVMGTAPANEVVALVEAVEESRFWDGESWLALDGGQFNLQIQRPGGDRLGRSETPAARLSPALERIRRRAFALRLTGARRVAAPVDEMQWGCPATTWKD